MSFDIPRCLMNNTFKKEFLSPQLRVHSEPTDETECEKQVFGSKYFLIGSFWYILNHWVIWRLRKGLGMKNVKCKFMNMSHLYSSHSRSPWKFWHFWSYLAQHQWLNALRLLCTALPRRKRKWQYKFLSSNSMHHRSVLTVLLTRYIYQFYVKKILLELK